MANKLIELFTTRYFSRILVLAGIVLFVLSFIHGPQDVYFNGYRLIATGVIFLGVGEWLNHPPQVSLTLDTEDSSEAQRKKHRKRNPSSIGNLFEIAALILICVGISKAFLN